MSLTFVNSIAEQARKVASKNGLYASVMIAQACLESGYGWSELSDPPNYNLFGIKGSYNGKSVMFKTAEQYPDGTIYYVDASFRKYPSYIESFEDNANLLREGLISNREFYKGTWKENTKSYKDATLFLTGRYATDVKYNIKLNQIIEEYNLTKYDILSGSDTPLINNDMGVVEMSGTVTFTEDVRVREQPTTTSKQVEWYYKGETLNYDRLHFKNGYIWLEYIRKINGRKAYVPFMPITEIWVKFK